MKKTIFISTFLLCLFTIHPSKAQLTYGFQTVIGQVVTPVIENTFALPVKREMATLIYSHNDAWFIKVDFAPANIQSFVKNGKNDHTVFHQFDLSYGAVYSFLHLSDIPAYLPRLTCSVGFSYQNIIDDVFYESYSLNIQTGKRGGIITEFGLLFHVFEFANVRSGVTRLVDYWYWDTNGDSDQLGLGYDALYFELNVDLIQWYKILREKYRRKK